MTLNDGFDRSLVEWLNEEAGRGAPGYLDEVLSRTTRTRQRPAWSSLERWLPVLTTLRFVPVPRPAWLLVVLGLVIATAAAVLVIGSQRPNPAPPFGLARNGGIAYGQDGDIYRLDPATGQTSALITGPADDLAPWYSRNGLQVVFLRAAGAAGDKVVIANADGSGVRELTGPLVDQNWFDWSQDGARLALVSTIEGISALTITEVDGSGSRVLDLDMDVGFATWRGPAGDELIFRGRSLSAPRAASTGIFAVRPDGTGLRQLSPTLGDRLGAYQMPVASPDGTRVAYTMFEHEPALGIGVLRLHVLDLASGIDTVIPDAPDQLDPTLPTDQGYATFSADGRLLAFQRYTSDRRVEVVVAPSDGSAIGKSIGPSLPFISGDGGPSLDFTPDASAVLVTYRQEGLVRLVPVDGSNPTTLSVGAELPSMQRLAP
jgi:hypothetical protein